MGYYTNEILTDLEKGNVYNAREIASIVYFKKDAVILCDDTVQFNSGDTESKFKVIDKMETYIHRNEQHSYSIPSDKSVIYKVEKVNI